tara:strand:- start:983 stop:1516 length:534 start_codon:yes stop_codon:yes gene_type:complete
MLTVNSLSGFGSRATFATVVIPGASDWQDIDSDLTFGTGVLDASSGNGAGRTVATFDGDFDIQFTITSETNMSFGIYPSSEDGTYNQAEGNGLLGNMTNSWRYNGGDDTIYWKTTAKATSVSFSGGDVFHITRVGSTIEFLIGGSSQHEFSETSSAELRFTMGIGGAVNIDDIQWTL